MRIRADFGVGRPAAEVWARLSSADGLACVPGLVVAGSEGSLTIGVGDRLLVFDGSAAVASDRRARTVTVEAKGAERSGRGRGRITMLLKVEEDGLFSTVDVEADLHLSGELASMTRLVAEAAYRLADRVAECLDRGAGAAPEPADLRPAHPAPEAPPPLEEVEERRGWVRRFLGRIGLVGGDR
jgi:carbon monoxide dehydrogenase subunit G